MDEDQKLWDFSSENRSTRGEVPEICGGCCRILHYTGTNEGGAEKQARTTMLRELMYFSTVYKWNSVLDYHSACLLEIERGNQKCFQHIHTTLVPSERPEKGKKRDNKSKKENLDPKTSSSTTPIRFSPWRNDLDISQNIKNPIDKTMHRYYMLEQPEEMEEEEDLKEDLKKGFYLI